MQILTEKATLQLFIHVKKWLMHRMQLATRIRYCLFSFSWIYLGDYFFIIVHHYILYFHVVGYSTMTLYKLQNAGFIASSRIYNCYGSESRLIDCRNYASSSCLSSAAQGYYEYPTLHCKGELGELTIIYIVLYFH